MKKRKPNNSEKWSIRRPIVKKRKIEMNEQRRFFVFLALSGLLFVFKLLTCSVSLSGDDVRHIMTADYWNFAKNILGGKVLYRDVIDHKGAYLFFVYAFFYNLWEGNISVIPIAETLVFASTCLSASVFCEHLGKKGPAIAAAFSALYAVLTVNVPLLNTEPMLLPVLFLAYRTIAFKETESKTGFFAWGCIFGLFLNAKYASVLYIAPIAVMAVFKLSFLVKGWKDAFLSTFSSILGAVIVNVPFLLLLMKDQTAEMFFYINKAASVCGVGKCAAYAFLSLVLLSISMAKCKAHKDAESFLPFLVFSSLALSLPMLTFNEYYFAPLVGMAFPAVIFGERKHLPRRFLFYTCFSVMVTNCLVFPDFSNTPTKSIAESFGMNNANTLYFCEDVGFGAYSGELYEEPLQWIPVKCLKNEEFANRMEELSKDRVENGRFEFIAAPCLKENEEDKGQIDILWESCFPAVMERYEEIYREKGFCIYRLKTP